MFLQATACVLGMSVSQTIGCVADTLPESHVLHSQHSASFAYSNDYSVARREKQQGSSKERLIRFLRTFDPLGREFAAFEPPA